MPAGEVRLVVLDGARKDVREATRWYDDHRGAAAAEALVDAVDVAIAAVADAPLRWPSSPANTGGTSCDAIPTA